MLVTRSGVELYVEVHGDGEPVLLIHGWPDSADVWRNQVPALTAAGYRVITPDLRGFGRSGRPDDVKSYRLANSAADMGAVLDAVGAPTAHVVGHDWGSAVAWATAMFRPDRVRTLTSGLTATGTWMARACAPPATWSRARGGMRRSPGRPTGSSWTLPRSSPPCCSTGSAHARDAGAAPVSGPRGAPRPGRTPR